MINKKTQLRDSGLKKQLDLTQTAQDGSNKSQMNNNMSSTSAIFKKTLFYDKLDFKKQSVPNMLIKTRDYTPDQKNTQQLNTLIQENKIKSSNQEFHLHNISSKIYIAGKEFLSARSDPDDQRNNTTSPITTKHDKSAKDLKKIINKIDTKQSQQQQSFRNKLDLSQVEVIQRKQDQQNQIFKELINKTNKLNTTQINKFNKAGGINNKNLNSMNSSKLLFSTQNQKLIQSKNPLFKKLVLDLSSENFNLIQKEHKNKVSGNKTPTEPRNVPLKDIFRSQTPVTEIKRTVTPPAGTKNQKQNERPVSSKPTNQSKNTIQSQQTLKNSKKLFESPSTSFFYQKIFQLNNNQLNNINNNNANSTYNINNNGILLDSKNTKNNGNHSNINDDQLFQILQTEDINDNESRRQSLPLKTSKIQDDSTEDLVFGLEKNKQKQKMKLNLEHIILIEKSLFVILNSLQQGTGILYYCKDYINVIYKEDLDGIDKLFKDEQIRSLLRGAIILERITIVLVTYSAYNKKLLEEHLTGLKDLIGTSHRNFMAWVEIILERMPPQSKTNSWYKKLRDVLDERLLNERLNKEQNIKILTENIVQMLKTINSTFQNDVKLFEDCKKLTNQLFKIEICEIQKILFDNLSKYFSNDDDNDYEIESERTDTTLSCTIRPDGLENQEPPYLPQLPPEFTTKIYTLVLDLDETLVHYEEVNGDCKFLIRPYCHEFLAEMSKYYEIVIFTAAMQDYADWVLNNLDKNKYISFRLYRQHATPNGASYIKDLSKLGRDLSRILIIDNIPENFQLQSDNGIFIRSWFDDPNDTALQELQPLLIEIVKKQVKDVREALRKFRDQMLENINKGIKQPHLNLTLTAD